jgi:hypothetical protein
MTADWRVCIRRMVKTQSPGWMLAVVPCCVVSFALGQQSDSGVVFRANTKLVEISVIAEVRQGDDKPAKPTTDLQREDFQIFDNGANRSCRTTGSEAGERIHQPGHPIEDASQRLFGDRVRQSFDRFRRPFWRRPF